MYKPPISFLSLFSLSDVHFHSCSSEKNSAVLRPCFYFSFIFLFAGTIGTSGNVCCDTSASNSQAGTEDGTETCSPAPAAEESTEAISSTPAAADDSGASSSTLTAEDESGGGSGSGGVGSSTGRLATVAGTPEPVLSLHYSTEGTTTSTIKLDFTDEW